MKRTILILIAIITLASCSVQDVCGTITGYNYNCNATGVPDCIYYIYVDGNKENVTFSTFNEAVVGEYICLTGV